MPTKKIVGAAAFTLALAGGGVAGALFGTPVLSGAQEDGTTSTTTDSAATPPPAPGGGPGLGMRGEGKADHLATAAEVLGMTAEELRTELQSGKSIADVAAEKNVDKQKVIDALVAAATARIDQMKSELPQRMSELVERDGLPGGPGGPGRFGHHRGPGMVNAVDDAATAIGVPVQDLRDALAGGKSIAQVAEEKGKNLDEVKKAMIADANERIDRALADAKITQDQATKMKADVASHIDEVVQREGLPMRGRGPGRMGPMGPIGDPPAGNQTQPEAQNTTA